jgi:uncharacterized membrane protein
MTQTSHLNRALTIDFIRGLVMLLMTIDHTRDMFSSVVIGAPIGTEIPITHYITRWITHLCAPSFIFLAGLSLFFRQSRHGLSIPSLQWEVIKRGLFLILVSSTIVSWLWSAILKDPAFTIYNAEL